MKFGITGVNAGMGIVPSYAAGVARAAEELGFESLWTVEHVVVPAGYDSQYPYSKTGKMPGGEDVPIPDPMIWLSYIAAVTERINLGTAIIILPQRNPVVFAKACATLDQLSGGRMLLGVGIGWLREEFDAIGVPFDERGARTEEFVGAMRALWTQQEPSYSGRFVSFDRAKMFPKPAQAAGIPVIVGGHTEAAARRAGRIGDGFFPWGIKAAELPPLLEAIAPRRAPTVAIPMRSR